MTSMIEVRDGAPVMAGSEQLVISTAGNGDLEIRNGRYSTYSAFGGFVAEDWQIMAPYPTDPFSDDIDPSLIAVLVKRDPRYVTALKARAFIEEYDLHDEPGPVNLRALFRSLGGTFMQPGALSVRDEKRYPGRTARIHGDGDISLFRKDGEDTVRRNELLALTIAAYALDDEDHEYGRGRRGRRDLSLGDARWDHPKTHLFAAMLQVTAEDAAGAIGIPAAETIGHELKVDPCTVQDAHQLWNEITHPEQPRI